MPKEGKVLADLVVLCETPVMRIPAKKHGRDRDWTAVRDIKEQLRPNAKLSNATVAAIVDATERVVTHNEKNTAVVTAADVAKGLRRLKKRLQ